MKYLDHEFCNFNLISDHKRCITDRYICNNCNIIVYQYGLLFISSASKVMSDYSGEKLVFNCNDIIIKSIIE